MHKKESSFSTLELPPNTLLEKLKKLNFGLTNDSRKTQILIITLYGLNSQKLFKLITYGTRHITTTGEHELIKIDHLTRSSFISSQNARNTHYSLNSCTGKNDAIICKQKMRRIGTTLAILIPYRECEIIALLIMANSTSPKIRDPLGAAPYREIILSGDH